MIKITRDMLKEKGACASGYRAFCEEFPDDEYPDGVGYQDLLDRCAENGRDAYASWLIDAFGNTTDVRKIEGDYISEKSIYVCGRLEVTGKIYCRGNIKAGESIEAGMGIEAGLGIEAGNDWGIYAGTHAKIRTDLRRVVAKTRPRNLMSGEFVEIKERHQP